MARTLNDHQGNPSKAPSVSDWIWAAFCPPVLPDCLRDGDDDAAEDRAEAISQRKAEIEDAKPKPQTLEQPRPTVSMPSFTSRQGEAQEAAEAAAEAAVEATAENQATFAQDAGGRLEGLPGLPYIGGHERCFGQHVYPSPGGIPSRAYPCVPYVIGHPRGDWIHHQPAGARPRWLQKELHPKIPRISERRLVEPPRGQHYGPNITAPWQAAGSKHPLTLSGGANRPTKRLRQQPRGEKSMNHPSPDAKETPHADNDNALSVHNAAEKQAHAPQAQSAKDRKALENNRKQRNGLHMPPTPAAMGKSRGEQKLLQQKDRKEQKPVLKTDKTPMIYRQADRAEPGAAFLSRRGGDNGAAVRDAHTQRHLVHHEERQQADAEGLERLAVQTPFHPHGEVMPAHRHEEDKIEDDGRQAMVQRKERLRNVVIEMHLPEHQDPIRQALVTKEGQARMAEAQDHDKQQKGGNYVIPSQRNLHR